MSETTCGINGRGINPGFRYRSSGPGLPEMAGQATWWSGARGGVLFRDGWFA